MKTKAAAFMLFVAGLFAVPISSPAAEPAMGGAFYGGYPFAGSRLTETPYSTFAWAVDTYLAKKKMIEEEWVIKQKNDLIFKTIAGAREFAKKKGGSKFALDHIHFQVVKSEHRISLYLDCNIIVFR